MFEVAIKHIITKAIEAGAVNTSREAKPYILSIVSDIIDQVIIQKDLQDIFEKHEIN